MERGIQGVPKADVHTKRNDGGYFQSKTISSVLSNK